MATPEGKAKMKLVRLLKKYGAYYVTAATHGYGKSGQPDYTGCSAGRYFGIEVKADTKVTPLQQKNLDAIEAAGGNAFVVRLSSKGEASGYDEVEDFLIGGHHATGK